ncbi:VOC family protein [Dactylosporangium sp. AC04546]|uniref:VOC family protein n=1 Tax=Dactylosporangium sp. AC04546 TaxID=2862460 RepID=UPI001EDD207C|nr:VOC family protein [Dactylosporangium sp. AC04546]WVK88252.1 VOC family protein [Dactylosporangium sp. AC04546]
MNSSVAFYRDGLGLPVKFADGDRFAALDGGGVTFALAAGDEALGTTPVASFKVDSVPEAVDRLTALGAELVLGPSRGPHEVRALLNDPAGNPFVVYAAA